MKNNIIIHFICSDQKGIISKLTTILYDSGNNILSIEQHVDTENQKFYIRISIEKKSIKQYFPKDELLELSKELKGKISFFDSNKKINVAILGTKESEPIYDLLIKYNSGEFQCEIPVLIGNHDELSSIAKQFDIDFCKIDDNKELVDVLKTKKIDLIILARYMQIIPENIVKLYHNDIINIHHSFLPAFKGAKPYHQAYKKGVKIIGATAHYVTDKLDEGPIICQDVISVSHKDSINQMIQLGREVERAVLCRAVRAHLEHKIIVYNNKTIIFN